MISKYLKTLLADNKRVIIPDFGGFVVKRSAAGDIISFNSFLKFNDDLLANIIIEEEGVEKSQALKQLKSFVKEINASLDEHGKFEIEDVGFLIKDKKGNVRFVDAIDDVVAAVLPSEKDAEKAQQTTDDSVNDKENPTEGASDDEEDSQEKEELANEEVEEEVSLDPLVKEEEKEKKKATPWIILAVLIIALGAWAVMNYAFDKESGSDKIEMVEGSGDVNDNSDDLSEKHSKLVEKKANDQMAVTVSSEKDGLIKRIIAFFKGLFAKKEAPTTPAVEVEKLEAKEYAMQPNQVDTVSGILVVADKNIAVKGEERYNVIIGSFTEKKNAVKFNKQMIEDGYASEIFDRYNGFEAVSTGAYPSLDIALKVCGQELKNTPDVWVLVK